MENATNVTVDILLSQAIQNPYLAAAMLIQFMLGFALGYLAVKAAKYILSFIAILVLGALLNVWSIGMSTDQMLRNLGQYADQIKSIAMALLQALGLLTIGPPSLGFALGFIIGVLKK